MAKKNSAYAGYLRDQEASRRGEQTRQHDIVRKQVARANQGRRATMDTIARTNNTNAAVAKQYAKATAKKTSVARAPAKKAGGRAGAKAKLAAARGSMTRANNNLAKNAQAGTSKRGARAGAAVGSGSKMGTRSERAGAKRAQGNLAKNAQGGGVSAGGRTVGEIGAGRNFAGVSPPSTRIGGLTKAPAKGGKVGQAGTSNE